MDISLELGPFKLLHPVGTGGMGTVWRAVHETQDHPVAIKVMTGERARQQHFMNAFREEVRAVARLHHPNIIRIFDSGTVSSKAEQLTEGQLVAGSPYLAMELADFSLFEINRDKLNWPWVRSILMHILDALAHSHARGLVHRDLKPDNVLFISDDENGRLKLSDFGLAHAMDTLSQLEAKDDMISGTPRYMAPEQATGMVRDQGPWTDLYALGCLTYWLVAGDAPFQDDDVQTLLRKHVSAPRPPFEPRIEVPKGFKTWVRQLLARKHQSRFRRAADAASALAELSGESSGPQITLTACTDAGEVDMTIVDRQATHILSNAVDAFAEASPQQEPATTRPQLPELPASWRYEQPPPDSIAMVGVGLGLYGLRDIPLVGREAERDRLWQAMADARHTGRPHGCIIYGPAGIGKTRLATWFGERAHEVGAVDILQASHSPISGPSHGLGRMFANHLGCTGLNRDQIIDRVRKFYRRFGPLDEDILHQCVALTELLATDADPDQTNTQIRFGRPQERYLVWKKLLQRLGEERPLLLILDDIHWGSDTLQFLRYLLTETTGDTLPVLIVATVRPEALDDARLAETLLAQIEKRALIDRLDLEPLSDSDHRELIENLLGLQADVAHQVARRTAGNPLFAIQLVGDWVERGILEISDDGFRLPEGERAPLPEDIHHLLVQRLEKLVDQDIDDPPNDALLSLELGAALGRKVDFKEWTHVCHSAGVSAPPNLLDAMASQSLAQQNDQGWNFVHGALREALERIAAERDRLSNHHHLCTEMLHELYDTSNDALAPRLARHLLAAGEDEEALEPLLRGMEHYRVTCDFEAATSLFQLYEQARIGLGIDDDDQRTVRGWLEKSALCQRRYRLDEADELLEKAEAICRRNEWELLLAKTLLDRAINARMRSHLEAGLDFARQALPLYERQGHAVGIARTLWQLGALQHWRGNLEKALPLLEDAQQRLKDLDAEHDRARCLHDIASAHTGLGHYRLAPKFANEAREAFESLGDLKGVSHCFTNLGENYRRRGDLLLAEKYYVRAMKTGERIGLNRDLVYCFNLAITLMEQKKFQHGLKYMKEALQRAKTSERPGYLGLTHAGLAACYAGLDDWTQFDSHLLEARIQLEQSSLADHDLARLGEIAAEQALQAGHVQHYRNACKFAIEQWQAVGDKERVQRLKKELESALT